MSNVLIDRNAVMDYLREQQANVIIEKNKNGFVNADVCDGMSSAIGAFMNFILQIPTAYGVDKVVERLEEEARCNQSEANELAKHGDYGTATMLQGIAKGYKYSADIVKSGGIE